MGDAKRGRPPWDCDFEGRGSHAGLELPEGCRARLAGRKEPRTRGEERQDQFLSRQTEGTALGPPQAAVCKGRMQEGGWHRLAHSRHSTDRRAFPLCAPSAGPIGEVPPLCFSTSGRTVSSLRFLRFSCDLLQCTFSF